jgi:hypothetical protein
MVFRRPSVPPARRGPFKPAVEFLEHRLAPAVIKVTTISDDLTPNDGSVSLREAITAINAGNSLGDPDIIAQNPGVFGTNDTIVFAIPGTGLHSIAVGGTGGTLGVPLPTLIKPVTINGYSQPGAAANTLANADNAKIRIELNGTGAGATADGLTLGAGSGGSTVMGLAINRFGGNGIVVDSNANLIAGNFVGTNPAGTAKQANGLDGILIVSASNNVIGGTTPGRRNIASGNGQAGIHVTGTTAAPATGNHILGNFAGVSATGTGAVGFRVGGGASGTAEGNFDFGIEISGGNANVIGGTTPGARNVVGFNLDGIELDDGAQANVVQGNYSGVGADGFTPVPNQLHGIALRSDGTLTPPLGPGQTNEPGVQNNQIGGTVPGAGNRVAFNGTAGVAVFGNPVPNGAPNPVPASLFNTGNSILGNVIFANGRANPTGSVGIDLVTQKVFPTDDGVTPNTPTPHGAGTGFTPPNLLENFPVLTAVTPAPGQTIVKGTLSSLPGAGPFRIEFFISTPDPAGGPPEGASFLGALTTVKTNAGGNASFTFTTTTLLAPGQVVTATATDPAGNTSEFSAGMAVPVTAPRSVSVAFGPAGQVVQLVSANGTFSQIDSTGRHVLGGGLRAASLAYGPAGLVQELVSANGTLTQFDASGAHVLAHGVLYASVAFGPAGEVLEIVSANGTWTQFDASGAHVLGHGIVSASAAFGPLGLALAVVSANGTLTLLDAFGTHVLHGGIVSAGLAFNPTGSAVVDAIAGDGTLLQFDGTGTHNLGKFS